ncbi:hypothetical protein PoB_004395400 [Plakobranchus ocellatus]|uniref:Uncharacterized protein n=1 Tax=Plakobranchus ocellatus TaxID=259542 RepID=A0AAV4BBE5_9GAST|nr:hypothetical protein PoB_004395400 [Plakobranchus ocellatus]
MTTVPLSDVKGGVVTNEPISPPSSSEIADTYAVGSAKQIVSQNRRSESRLGPNSLSTTVTTLKEASTELSEPKENTDGSHNDTAPPTA